MSGEVRYTHQTFQLHRTMEIDGTPKTEDHESLTQINDRDRAHMLAFPLHHKAQVMKQIESLAPA